MALSVKNLIEGIELNKYLLPTIQRGFVRDTKKIEDLFDSLMMNFPIASFLFWNVTKDRKTKFKFYPFVKDYNDGEFDARKSTNFSDGCDPVAVLDGQQRMTALYIGLKGSYTPQKRANAKNSPPIKNLYLNLLHKHDDSDDDSEGNVSLDSTYTFKFLTEEEANSRDDKTYWFEVGKILDKNFDDQNYIWDFLDEEFGSADKKLPRNILNKLWGCIRNDSESLNVTSIGAKKPLELDEILNIFVRINNGGKPINAADLLMSFAEAQLSSSGFNVEEKVVDLVKNLNGDNKFDIGKDFILRAALILTVPGKDKNDIKFSVKNFEGKRMDKIRDEWKKISDALKSAVDLVQSYGFNKKSIPSNNALIPIAHYIYLNSNYNADKKKIMYWFIATSFSEIFRARTDEALNRFRNTLNDNHASFPLEAMLKASKCDGKNLVDSIMATNYSDKQRARMALTILYGANNLPSEFAIDHMFPQAQFQQYQEFVNQGAATQNDFHTNVDALPNLQPLTQEDNSIKGAKFFNDWLEEKFPDEDARADYKNKNFVPDVDLKDLDFGRFKNFFIGRAKKIREQLIQNLNLND